MNLRKTMIIQETIEADGFGKACDPITRVVAIAVIQNPFAGRFVEDLSPLFDIGGQLAEQLMGDAVKILAGPPVSYGKAAIVGVAGELEHGAAMIHPKLGKPMRAAVGGGKALIPSNAKVAAAGVPIDLPLGHKDEAWSFDHFDTMTVMVADAPRPDEIVLCMAVSDGCPSFLSHPGHQRIFRRRRRRVFHREGGKGFSGNGVWICLPAIGKVLGAAEGATSPWRSRWHLHRHTRTLKQNPAVFRPRAARSDDGARRLVGRPRSFRCRRAEPIAPRGCPCPTKDAFGIGGNNRGTKQGSVSDVVHSRRSSGSGIRASRCRSGVPHTDSAMGFVAP